jgi:hypothetical protein
MNNLPPKPAGAVFGIRADGKPKGMGTPSLAEAEAIASGLVAPGQKVEIFDMVTG